MHCNELKVVDVRDSDMRSGPRTRVPNLTFRTDRLNDNHRNTKPQSFQFCSHVMSPRTVELLLVWR